MYIVINNYNIVVSGIFNNINDAIKCKDQINEGYKIKNFEHTIAKVYKLNEIK